MSEPIGVQDDGDGVQAAVVAADVGGGAEPIEAAEGDPTTDVKADADPKADADSKAKADPKAKPDPKSAGDAASRVEEDTK